MTVTRLSFSPLPRPQGKSCETNRHHFNTYPPTPRGTPVCMCVMCGVPATSSCLGQVRSYMVIPIASVQSPTSTDMMQPVPNQLSHAREMVCFSTYAFCVLVKAAAVTGSVGEDSGHIGWRFSTEKPHGVPGQCCHVFTGDPRAKPSAVGEQVFHSSSWTFRSTDFVFFALSAVFYCGGRPFILVGNGGKRDGGAFEGRGQRCCSQEA